MKASSVAILQSRFALLLTKVALNVQNGQTVVLWKAPVESQQFIRKLVEACYLMGAANVDVFWTDPYLDRVRLSASPTESCCVPQTERSIEALEKASRSKAAIVLFDCTCAGMFAELDSGIVSRENSCETRLLGPMWEALSRSSTTWTATIAPNMYWARKVYPHETPSNSLRKLWGDIALACRISTKNFEAEWIDHIDRLSQQADRFNSRRYSMLHYRGPKADLRVQLPKFHVWRGPDFVTEGGIHYVPDIPMEEVFTLPHREGVEGWIMSEVPFVVNNEIVQGMTARFENGFAMKVTANQGEQALNAALDTDEGARRLGEVAIVPADSPTGYLRKLFYNTIIDENAACHIAFGRAYRFSAKDANHMSDGDFLAAGGNMSSIHIDFMIDAATTEVWGIRSDGQEELIYPQHNNC